jgi:hypothetical protein
MSTPITFTPQNTHFTIKTRKVPRAAVALRLSYYRKTSTCASVSNFEDLIKEWGCSVTMNPKGEAVGITVPTLTSTGDTWNEMQTAMSDMQTLFNILARFVEPGSYVVYYGSNGTIHGWYFDGLTAELREGYVSFGNTVQGAVIHGSGAPLVFTSSLNYATMTNLQRPLKLAAKRLARHGTPNADCLTSVLSFVSIGRGPLPARLASEVDALPLRGKARAAWLRLKAALSPSTVK